MEDEATLGKILVDGKGMTLYIFTNDQPDKSNCTGDCLVKWPPFLTKGTPKLGDGIDASLVGTDLAQDAGNGRDEWVEIIKPTQSWAERITRNRPSATPAILRVVGIVGSGILGIAVMLAIWKTSMPPPKPHEAVAVQTAEPIPMTPPRKIGPENRVVPLAHPEVVVRSAGSESKSTVPTIPPPQPPAKPKSEAIAEREQNEELREEPANL